MRRALPILFGLLLCSCAQLRAPKRGPAPGDWPAFGRDPGGARHSPLEQINRKNVGSLERAWNYKSGDLERFGTGGGWVFECAPLVAEGKLFIITPLQRAVALDPVDGKELWSFDSQFDRKTNGGALASRGVAYWKDGELGRVLFPVLDGRLILLDAATGQPLPSFGAGGTVNVRELLRMPGNELRLTSPPTVCGDLAVVGFSIGDGPNKTPAAPVIALNLHTGALVWAFFPVPQRPGEFGQHTWEGESWKNRGAANVWAPMSYDPEFRLVYLPTTSPKWDFYGGDRKGQNLFSNSVVALDAATGQRVWHFQTIHHDIWDYDLPAQPVLCDLKVDGEKIPAVAQIGKTGFVYLFNRKTGKPVFPIEERAVPASDVPGEEASKTQPFPTKPPAFTQQGMTEAGLANLDPASREHVVNEFKKYRNDGLFTPPSLGGSIVMPGFHGGGNWSGGAFDPESGLFYVNSTEMMCMQKVIPAPQGDFGYTIPGYQRLRDPNGYPANAPPWGLLNAIDLNKGEMRWRSPLGEFEELTARGVPKTGQENFGGPIVTAGGLVFIASTMDECLRAFDKTTGEELFKTKLDAAGYAAPTTYLGRDGNQYVVICCGGGGKLGTKSGDAVIAFRLKR